MTATMKRKRVRGKPEDRREQILAEATRLIGERGYYGFSIHELGQRCQLSNPGLLHYFGSKERLLIALLEDRDRRDAEVVTTAVGLAPHEPLEAELTLKQVVDVLHATVVRNSTQPELVRLYAVLQAEAMNEGHPAHEYFLAREAAGLDAYARLVAPYVPEPLSMARHLAGLMLGLEQQWVRAGQTFDLVAEWDRAAARLLPSVDRPPRST